MPVETGWRITALAGAWLIGTAAHLQQAGLAPAATAWALALVGTGAVAAAWRWRSAFALAVVGVALWAFAAADWRAASRLAEGLDVDLEGRDLLVTGLVASLPQREPSALRFRFAVEAATLEGRPVSIPPRLSISWYASRARGAEPARATALLRAGQRWRATLRLRRPHGLLNPHGADQELRLFEQGVGATATVREQPPPQLLQADAGFPVERLRQQVRDAIERQVPDRRAAGVLAALAIGDQGAIDPADWDVYRRTGIAHLVSISGLHIAMFGWLAGALTGRLWRRSRRAMRWLPVPHAVSLSAVVGATGYAVLSGWGVPAQRTVWMLVVVTLSRTLGLRWPWTLVLAAAAVTVTAFDPWALIQPGFWLSFGAVALLMAASPRVAVDPAAARSRPGWRGCPQRAWMTLRNDFRTQLVATVGLTPLTLVFFQQVSVVGFAANFVAIPLVTLVITPLALLGLAMPWLWSAAAAVVLELNALLGWLAARPGAVLVMAVAPAWMQCLGLAGAALLVMPLPWRLRVMALPLLMPMLWPPRELPANGRFDVIALDVGQGTSVLVRTRHRLLLFDAGPRYGSHSDAGNAGDRVLLPFLKARGETRIDRLVLSHGDTDHVGGAAALFDALPVVELWSSLDPGHPLLARASQSTACERGQAWEWDGVRFEVLWPQRRDPARKLSANAKSCVLRVSAGDRSVLLTGDIERHQEAALIDLGPEALRSHLLIAPHHGSKTSSSAAFLDAVGPRVAVFQASYRNRFGHPAAEVVRRYHERGIATLASPTCGAFLFLADGPPQGTCLRDARRRYWHHPDRANGAKTSVASE